MRRSIARLLVGGVLLAAAATALCRDLSAQSPQSPTPTTAADCAPANGMAFICGAIRPEDLIQIPGTRWIIASGFQNGAGLKLVDARSKTLSFWYNASREQIKPDQRRFANCPGPLDISSFNVQGISLRQQAAGKFRLYATNHGGRETIEVFDVAVDGDAAPTLTWIGCVLMPDYLPANGVTSFSDGELLATNLARPGTTIADYMQQRPTGGVYAWKPGEPQFHLLPGTELPGNNGIEVALDEKSFYVVSFGLKAVFEYSRADSSRPLRSIATPGFMPDNLRWYGSRLIAAGMMTDEPACGGLRKIADGVADMMACHRGYVAAALDPASFTFSILAYGEPNPGFNGVSTAIVVGDELWLGSWQVERIAYRPLHR
jgi:hypothetical protein